MDHGGYDMELHLVHKAADGSNAVIGVFLNRGDTSGALAPIFAALPDDLNVHHPIDGSFNPAAFLPRLRNHFRYPSDRSRRLRAPGGVEWLCVLSRAGDSVSDEDMAQFAERIHFNARPVQREARPSHGGGR